MDDTTKKIIRRLYFYLSARYHPIASNCYIYNWESDLLAINKESNLITEYEVKVSRPDFKAEFTKKSKKHEVIKDAFELNCNHEFVPNYFYYITPPGLLDKSEIPEYAGLMEMGIYGVRFVKRAPRIHKTPTYDGMNVQLLNKIYYKYWGLDV